jgi:hypothetical protein
MLHENEKIIADSVYQDPNVFITPRTHPQSAEFQQQVRARHENVNGKIKRFGCLNSFFRHGPAKQRCFFAVAQLVELIIEFEEPLRAVPH